MADASAPVGVGNMPDVTSPATPLADTTPLVSLALPSPLSPLPGSTAIARFFSVDLLDLVTVDLFFGEGLWGLCNEGALNLTPVLTYVSKQIDVFIKTD